VPVASGSAVCDVVVASDPDSLGVSERVSASAALDLRDSTTCCWCASYRDRASAYWRSHSALGVEPV